MRYFGYLDLRICKSALSYRRTPELLAVMRSVSRTDWFLPLIAMLVVGCSHTKHRTTNHCPMALPPALALEFSYPKPTVFAARPEIISTNDSYTIRRIEMPAAPHILNSNRTVVVEYYDPNVPAPTPVIMLLPILGGKYEIEKLFAKYFARHGFAVVVVLREKKLKDPQQLDEIEVYLRQTVLDNKWVIDWMETQTRLDLRRLGVFGISMGGIKGALLTALDDRVQAAALAMPGGDLPYIVAHSTEPGITKRREKYMKEHNLTVEEFEARLRKVLTCDPLTFAPYVDPRKVLMMLAEYDTVVPIAKGRELKERMGNPETITVPAGHYTAVLFVPYIQAQTLEFFRKRFVKTASDTLATNGRKGIASAPIPGKHRR